MKLLLTNGKVQGQMPYLRRYAKLRGLYLFILFIEKIYMVTQLTHSDSGLFTEVKLQIQIQ